MVVLWMVIGAGAGLALGALTDAVGPWLALGLGLGTVAGAAHDAMRRR